MTTFLVAAFSLLLTAGALAQPTIELKSGTDLRLETGNHFITSPISGDNLSDIKISAADGAKPVISGGKLISGWKQLPNGHWQTTLPEVAAGKWYFRELFVEREPATRARHPDSGTFRIAKAGEDRRTSFQFNPGDIGTWDQPGQIEFAFYHDWSLSRVMMKSIDQKNHSATLRDPVGQTTADHYAMDHFEKQPRYHLENHLAFITKPGEWHLDRNSGTLTYFAHEGVDPNRRKVIAPYASAILHLKNCHDIHFEGITFAHANWQLPPGGSAGAQAAFHQIRPASGTYEKGREAKPAAIEIYDSHAVTFKNCHFNRLSASGLWVRNGCRDITIANSRFDEIGANALMIGDQSANEQNATRQVSVRGCTIENCGTTDYGAVGIWIGIANHINIITNTLKNLPYTGISVGWRWSPGETACHHNLIEGNHIHQIMQKLSDGAGVYTLGQQPGTIIRNNRVHDVPVNAGSAESNGMFFDQGSADILVEENIIYRIAKSPLRFHRSGKILVRKNQLFRTKENIPAVRYNRTPEENITLQQNTESVGAPSPEN